MKKLLALLMVAFATVIISGCSKQRSEDEIWETALVSFGIQKLGGADDKYDTSLHAFVITSDIVCLTWFNDEFEENGGSITWKAHDEGSTAPSTYILIDETHSGTVDTPTRFEGDKTVIVEATIKMGSRSETRTWKFIVKADDWKTTQAKEFYQAMVNLNVTSMTQFEEMVAADPTTKDLYESWLQPSGLTSTAYNAFISLEESANKEIDRKGLRGLDEDGNAIAGVIDYIQLYLDLVAYVNA